MFYILYVMIQQSTHYNDRETTGGFKEEIV